MTSPPSDDPPTPPGTPARSTPGAPEPSLIRLAHALADLNPALAHRLCLAGLAAMTDPLEREAWRARLGSFVDEAPPFGAGPTLPA